MFSGNFAKFVAPKHKAMINTNEVRVGNFVLNHKKEPTKVMQTLMDNIGGAINGWDETNFDPIPLTEEWLLKAGFEFKGKRIRKDWFYLWNDENKIVFALAEMQDETGTYLEIKYVHQLQNLYFALTGKELEFKL